MGESGSTIVAPPTCAEPTCSEPGQWRPVIHVFDEHGVKVPGEAVLPNLVICTGHREEATKDIIESDFCWDEVLAVFSRWGRGKIIRSKTQVSYEPI
jgi:hypothetical protein